MRKLLSDDNGSVVPVILFILTIFISGALYTVFMLEIGFPTFDPWIPSGDSKTFIYMGLYGVPLIVLVVGVFALLKEGLKRTIYGGF